MRKLKNGIKLVIEKCGLSIHSNKHSGSTKLYVTMIIISYWPLSVGLNVIGLQFWVGDHCTSLLTLRSSPDGKTQSSWVHSCLAGYDMTPIPLCPLWSTCLSLWEAYHPWVRAPPSQLTSFLRIQNYIAMFNQKVMFVNLLILSCELSLIWTCNKHSMRRYIILIRLQIFVSTLIN